MESRYSIELSHKEIVDLCTSLEIAKSHCEKLALDGKPDRDFWEMRKREAARLMSLIHKQI